jgi:uncharacterized membrane protein
MSERKDSHTRTLIKTVLWRFIATGLTVLVAYFVFNDIGNALKVGGIEFFVKMAGYYLHERAWQLFPPKSD